LLNTALGIRIFRLPEGRFGIAIGDVSGKGIGAALMMASLEASLRGQAAVGAPLPAAVRRLWERGKPSANTDPDVAEKA